LAQLKEYAKEKGTEYLCSVLTYYQEKGRINTDNVLKVAQTIQNIIYAMKDHAYHASRFNPDETEGFDKMVDEIIFAVSLILDGIIIEGQE
jgi:hypothetical protein